MKRLIKRWLFWEDVRERSFSLCVTHNKFPERERYQKLVEFAIRRKRIVESEIRSHIEYQQLKRY